MDLLEKDDTPVLNKKNKQQKTSSELEKYLPMVQMGWAMMAPAKKRKIIALVGIILILLLTGAGTWLWLGAVFAKWIGIRLFASATGILIILIYIYLFIKNRQKK